MRRKTAWLTPSECTCGYAYGSGNSRVVVPPQPFPIWMHVSMPVIMPQCGMPDPETWPDCANCNWYEEAKDAVGPHADDEDMFEGKYRAILIISLSLGGTRHFEVRGKTRNARAILRQPLADGDLLAMEQWTQVFLKHSVARLPESSTANPHRINITWRWLAHHRQGCPHAGLAIRPVPQALPLNDPCPASVQSSDAAWAHIRNDAPSL